jgi:hypothetical protein
MKTMIFLVALAMTSAAWGQAQKEPAKPSPTKEAAKQEASKQEVSKPAAVAKKSKRTQDARHCLQRSGNTEIIKCAEEFL